MKLEKIPLIGLERFKEHPEHITFIDENIAVIDSLTEMLPVDEKAVKLDCCMIVFCQEGNLSLNINGKQHQLQKDYCAILPPNTILRTTIANNRYVIRIAAASRTFLSEILSATKETWHIFHYLMENPIHPIHPAKSYKMYLYKELLITLIQEEPHIYSRQARRFHFAGLFCEMMALLNKMIPDSNRHRVSQSRATYIARDFLELVNADNGSHRSVTYYADLLCYSAKYLSSAIKEVTGKNPLQIINEHAVKEIKFKLKHTNKSMKELADEFDFTNPSFFGKFVKAHIGMSPLQYRLSDEEAE